MVEPYRLRRDTPQVGMQRSVLDGEHVIYAVPYRRVQHATELLLACWHLQRLSLSSTTIFVLRDDQDWFLFKIANGITDYRAVILV